MVAHHLRLFQRPERSSEVFLAELDSVVKTAAEPLPTTGIVKAFDKEKGYGWIIPTGGGPDLFFHYSELPADLPQVQVEIGMTLEYTVGDSGKKLGTQMAKSIKKPPQPPPPKLPEDFESLLAAAQTAA